MQSKPQKVTKTKRQLQAEQTKRHIFETALRMLEEQDFESITVRDIVREADVSIGSFYNSYASKLEVFYETYKIADEFFETAVRKTLTQDTQQARICCFFEAYAHYNSVQTPCALTKLLYNPDNPYFYRSSDYGIQPILLELVQQAQVLGEFSHDWSSEEISRFLMVCVRGVVYDWCILDGAYDLTERVKNYIPLLLCAFQKHPKE